MVLSPSSWCLKSRLWVHNGRQCIRLKGLSMLAATLGYVDRYDFQNERFQKVYAFLRQNDLSALPLGKHEVAGDEVFANVQEYDTVPAAQKHYEAHRRYFDIQYIVSGEEAIAVTPVEGVKALQEFDEASDFCLYDEPKVCSWVPLHAGELMILSPEEAHKPGCALAGPEHVRKIVVKVAL